MTTSRVVDILTDIGRNLEHLLYRSEHRYHGPDCLWCVHTAGPGKLRQLTQHPSGSDFKVCKEQVVKRALLVAIDYDGRSTAAQQIAHCHDFLQQRFLFNDIRVLSQLAVVPTKYNLSRMLDELTRNTRPGDFLLFIFVGRSRRLNGRANGHHVLVPSDCAGTRYVSLQAELFAKVRPGVHLTAILDCGDNRIDLPRSYVAHHPAIRAFDHTTARHPSGTIVALATNGCPGRLCRYTIQAMVRKNLRITAEELLQSVSALAVKRGAGTIRLAASRHVVPEQYYVCLTNR